MDLKLVLNIKKIKNRKPFRNNFEQRKMVNKKSLKNYSAVFKKGVLFCCVLFFSFCSDKDTGRINEKIHLLKNETVAFRFKIIPHSNGKKIVATKFFNLDGIIVGRFENDYCNEDIVLNFCDIFVNQNKHIVFPLEMKMINNNSEVKCVDLKQYYVHNDYPEIYASKMSDSLLNQEIGRLYSLVVNDKEKKIRHEYGEISFDSIVLTKPNDRVMYEFKILSDDNAKLN